MACVLMALKGRVIRAAGRSLWMGQLDLAPGDQASIPIAVIREVCPLQLQRFGAGSCLLKDWFLGGRTPRSFFG